MCEEIEERSDEEYSDSSVVDDVFSCFNSSDVYYSGEGDNILLEGRRRLFFEESVSSQYSSTKSNQNPIK